MGPQSAGGGQNPFMQILAQLQQGQSGAIGGPKGPAMGGGGMPSAGGAPGLQGGTPGGAPMPQAGMPGGPGSIAGQQQPGTNATKMLITALQSLHTFALQSMDGQESALVRQIIILLSNLIQREQSRQLQGNNAPIGGIQTPMGRGATGGVQAQPASLMGR